MYIYVYASIHTDRQTAMHSAIGTYYVHNQNSKVLIDIGFRDYHVRVTYSMALSGNAIYLQRI